MRIFLTVAALMLVFSCQKNHVEFCEDAAVCNIRMSPNPFYHDFKLEMQSNTKGEANLQVFTSSGKLYMEEDFDLAIGRNVFNVDGSCLPFGFAFYRVSYLDGYETGGLIREQGYYCYCEEQCDIEVYPKIFTDHINLKFFSEEPDSISITIEHFDITVYHKTKYLKSGQNLLMIEIDPLDDGLTYYLNVASSNFERNFRLFRDSN